MKQPIESPTEEKQRQLNRSTTDANNAGLTDKELERRKRERAPGESAKRDDERG